MAKDLFCLAFPLLVADALCMKTNASSVGSKVADLIHLGPAHLTDKLNLSFHHSFAGSITKEHCKNSNDEYPRLCQVRVKQLFHSCRYVEAELSNSDSTESMNIPHHDLYRVSRDSSQEERPEKLPNKS